MEVRIPPQPAPFVNAPQEVGREEVNGVATVHLQGAVATDAVVDCLLGVVRGAPGLLGDGEPPAPWRRQGSGGSSAPGCGRIDPTSGSARGTSSRIGSPPRSGSRGPRCPSCSWGHRRLARRPGDVGGFDEEAEIVAPANPPPLPAGGLGGLAPQPGLPRGLPTKTPRARSCRQPSRARIGRPRRHERGTA